MPSLDLLDLSGLGRQPRCPAGLRVVPAVWVIGRRTFLWQQRAALRSGVLEASETFVRFKDGDASLVPVLAQAMARQVKIAGVRASAIVPVPLAPGKVERGELDRAGVLADALGVKLGLPVVRALILTEDVGKRAMLAVGFSRGQFEERYLGALRVELEVQGDVMIVDDLCANGSTMRCCAAALSERAGTIVGVTAGQLASKATVTDPESLQDNRPSKRAPLPVDKRSKQLSDELVELYEEMIRDKSVQPHLRLGAANALRAHLGTVGQGEADDGAPSDDQAPDPMADLDMLEAQRRKRAKAA